MGFDMNNRPAVRPALILTPVSANPIPLGQAGLWYDGATLSIVAADGTISVLSSTGQLDPVRLATAAALPANTYSSTTQKLTAAANGALTVDGVLVANGDRILVKNEVADANNGIYTVSQKGTAGTPYILTRAADFNATAEIRPASRVAAAEGTANADLSFGLTTNAPIVLDTTALTFA